MRTSDERAGGVAGGKAGWTPGPWRIKRPATRYEERRPIQIVSDAGSVCELIGRRFEPDLTSSAVPEVEQRANARLIAAAPELLKVLKEMLRVRERQASAYGFQGVGADITAARALLARVEGGAL